VACRIVEQHADVTLRSRRIKARRPGNCGLPRVSPGFSAIRAVALRVALLQPVYDRSTEGFDTTDLKAGNSLLDALE
jgi:hypothetical protein